MPIISIDTASIHDLLKISQIEQAAHVAPWSQGMLADSLNGEHFCWKIQFGNEIVGYLLVMQIIQQLELLNVAVSPVHQGKGVGKKLIQHLTDFALANHIHSTFLEVRRSNYSAIGLYQKLGFEEVGVRKNYYPGKKMREDALVMQCIYDKSSS